MPPRSEALTAALPAPAAVPAPGRGRPGVVYFYLAIVVATWAVNWPLMKLALQHVGPLVFVVLRILGGLVVLAPVLVVRRQRLMPLRGERLALLGVGLFQVAGFLIFGILGLALVPPGRAIVLAYTMPLWAIPIGLMLTGESIAPGKLVGAAVGFAGLVLFMNPTLVDWGRTPVLVGNISLLLAAICWATGSCLYRRRSWRTPFWTQTFWQLAASAVVIVALGVGAVRDWSIAWSPGLVAILVYNWVVTTALAYFLWIRVLSVLSATTAGQITTLTPVCGFLLSATLFGGAVTPDVLVSIGLIVIGIVLALRR